VLTIKKNDRHTVASTLVNAATVKTCINRLCLRTRAEGNIRTQGKGSKRRMEKTARFSRNADSSYENARKRIHGV
jgi:hypothetical protein